MNDLIIYVSRCWWDFFLLASILLLFVVVAGKLISQPARRMAIHWSTAAGLCLLALLSAVPDWSILHISSPPPEAAQEWMQELEPTTNPAVQIAELPPSFRPELPKSGGVLPADVSSDTVAAEQITVVDIGIILFSGVAIGSIISLLWLVLGAWQVRRLRSRAATAPEEYEVLLKRLSAGRPTPKLGVVTDLSVAAAIGLRRPMILLPQSFLELAKSQKLQTVLAHELAHIRHRDLWLLALVRSLLLVLWPNPLYWLWRRKIRLDQETLADTAAAEVSNRTDYAEQLVSWARGATETKLPRLASSIGLWESPSQLKQRVAILLDEKLTILKVSSKRWRAVSAGLLAILAIGLSLVTLQPADDLLAQDSVDDRVDEQPARFVRVVFGSDQEMTFEGKPTTWEELPQLLEKMPNRSQTVLELAITTDEISLRKMNELNGKISTLANRYGFLYSSFIGVHPLGSRGTQAAQELQKLSSELDITTHSPQELKGADELLQFAAQEGVIRRLDPQLSRPGFALPDDMIVQAAYQFDPREVLKNAAAPFDKRAGYENAFARALEGLEKDPYGPRLNAQRDLMNHLAGTVHLLVSRDSNATPAESFLIAIQASKPRRLLSTIEQFMKTDPQVLHSELIGRHFWVVRDEQGKHSFVCVELGHLLIASDTSLLRKVFDQNADRGITVPAFSLLQKRNNKTQPAIVAPKPIDTEEVAYLQELVDSYAKIFKEVDALHQAGATGGETDKWLLAKYHYLSARAKLLEEKQVSTDALQEYRKAATTAQKYADAARAVYDSGRITLTTLLEAQQLRAEARRNSQQAGQRLKDAADQSVSMRKTDESAQKSAVKAGWMPPENPDPVAIRKEAVKDARAGRYEVALAKHFWYHQNALALRPSQSGVRLTFALSEWRWLADRYLPAMEKLKQVRNEVERKVRDEAKKHKNHFEDFYGFSQLFSEYEALNQTLREEERTVKTFQWLDEYYPQQAKLVFPAARKTLIRQGAKQLYGKYLDPTKDLRKIGERYRQLLNMADKNDDSVIRESAERLFLRNVSTMVAMLVKLNRAEEAKEVATKARQLVENEEILFQKLEDALQSALEGQLPK